MSKQPLLEVKNLATYFNDLEITLIGSIISIEVLKNHPKVFAVGVNCTNPKYISDLIPYIKASCGDNKVIIYPNSGELYNAQSKTWMGLSEPKYFVEMSKEWINLGADIIGGCCRIGPDHIRRISDIFQQQEL